jgi:hypothetical protein
MTYFSSLEIISTIDKELLLHLNCDTKGPLPDGQEKVARKKTCQVAGTE